MRHWKRKWYGFEPELKDNPLIFGGAQVLTLWIQWIGIFADDPIFEEVTQGIEADRERELAGARHFWAEDKTGV